MSSTSSSSPSAAATSAISSAREAMGEQGPKMKKLNSMNMNQNPNRNRSGGGGGRRMPSAEELIKHYESQGMDTKQASVKVINDLQKALFRLITTKGKNPQQQQPGVELDVIKGRLMSMDMKLDSKPGYPQMLGLGVASSAVFRGLETWAFPQVANIWNAVRSTTNSK